MGTLTKKQIEMLWGGDGPYSQTRLVREVRILDDKVSREFLVVEVDINPTTFELIKRYRNDGEFKDDIAIQQLLDHAEYRGPADGYVSMAFSDQYQEGDEEVVVEANLALQRTQETIIKMHKFVLDKYFVLK